MQEWDKIASLARLSPIPFLGHSQSVRESGSKRQVDGVHSNMDVVRVLEHYHKARMSFASTLADMASNPQNVDALHALGAMALLQPLLQDSLPGVQNAAVLALGRLANASEEWARSIVQRSILPELSHALSSPNRHHRKAAAFAMKAVARHPSQAQDLADGGALPALADCLAESNGMAKEMAACALGHVARCNEELATRVADTGATRLLAACLQDPDPAVQRMSLSALGDIAKHSPALAREVAQKEGAANAVALLASEDSKLKRQVCASLCQIVKHNEELAETVMQTDHFSAILACLQDEDESLRKSAATLVREIVRQSARLAKQMNSCGGVGPLIDYVVAAEGNHKLPGIMALGYVASSSEEAALAIIASEGVPPLVEVLRSVPDDSVKCATAWAISQLGGQSAGHARGVAQDGALLELARVLQAPGSSEDLRLKSRKALSSTVERLTHLPALDALLQGPDIPVDVLEKTMRQLSMGLAKDTGSRESFHASGGFARARQLCEAYTASKEQLPNGHLQERAKLASKIGDHFDAIQAYYPFEMSMSAQQSTRVLEKLSSSIMMSPTS